VKTALLSVGLLVTVAMPSGLWAQHAGYSQTNLVSNTARAAKTTDSQLLTPLGDLFYTRAGFMDRQQQQRHLYHL
jgi:hypothetical protein